MALGDLLGMYVTGPFRGLCKNPTELGNEHAREEDQWLQPSNRLVGGTIPEPDQTIMRNALGTGCEQSQSSGPVNGSKSWWRHSSRGSSC
jgi:hypothetical protein